MNVFQHVEALVLDALARLKQEGRLAADLAVQPITVSEPQDPTHGDIYTNAAMVHAKAARMKPRDIAEGIAGLLRQSGDIARVDVAGPGFINMTLAPAVWQRVVAAILAAGPAYGRSALGKGQKVDVEYVSANPTGPMHIGHCRGAVFGDALASLLQFAGYDVTREYYVNDAGGQVAKLAQSVFLRYREALGETIGPIPEGYYPGEYLKPIGAALASKHGKALLAMAEAERLAICRKAAVEALLGEIKADLAALGVRHDVFFSEASLTEGRDQIAAAVERLESKGLIFKGRLPRPKGHDDDDWEDREQTLFRSTAFGDDMDRALKKSDGSYTYFAGDVGYHLNKLERRFDHYYNVLGADHVGYIPRLKAVVAALSDTTASYHTPVWVVAALSDTTASYHTPVCQLVKVLRGGQPVTMSKRAGTFVALRDVVDEVGADPVRFMMVMRKNDTPLDFDLEKVIEKSKDNPVFYVQYAHARSASVFRNAREAFPDLDRATVARGGHDLSALSDPAEIDLVKQLARFPRLIEGAANPKAPEPHRLPFYLYDLASSFHQLWNRGNESPHLRFIQPGDRGATAARLALVAATQQVISSGLSVLGVLAPEEMR